MTQRSHLAIAAGQALAAATAVVMALWAGMPWPGIVLLGVYAAEIGSLTRRRTPRPWSLPTAWVLFAITAFWLWAGGYWKREPGAGCIGLFNSLAIFLAASLFPSFARTPWRRLGMAWALFGDWCWLACAYTRNWPLMFYAGLLLAFALILLIKRWFRLPAPAIIALNSLIVLIVALPTVDLILHPHGSDDADPDPSKRYFSYEMATRNPAAFVSWSRYEGRQFRHIEFHYYIRNTGNVLPFRLKPDSHGHFFKSRFDVNHLGFRGKEISFDKGDAYRIVCLGESTTFGITMNAGDKPWPDLLEEKILRRLKPGRPVQVINAGVGAYNLNHNLYRLTNEIVALQPDMIISYHGFNGFRFVDPALPATLVKEAPLYRDRPLRLLADLEFTLDVLAFRHQLTAGLRRPGPPLADPQRTQYADLYRELIGVAKAHGIRLVLANFSMAVNHDSDPKVIDFYGRTFLGIYGVIKANEIHSAIVATLAADNPEVIFADTHPHLDGDHDKFTDLMHMTEEGREQLAETFFARIRPTLEKELPRQDK